MKLPSSTMQFSCAELFEQLVAFEARRSIGRTPGSFVTKRVKERTYVYLQYSEPAGTTKEVYVGPKSPAFDAVAARFATERNALRDGRVRIDELAAIVRAGGRLAGNGVSPGAWILAE